MTGALTADTAFISLLELAMGTDALDTSKGVLPTYSAGDAFIGLSGDSCYQFNGGANPAGNSLTMWKKTRTGHECATGCVIERVRFRGGLDEYTEVTFSGSCKQWGKFEPTTLGVAITAGAKTSFTVARTAGVLCVGAYVSITPDTGSDVDVLVTAYNAKTGVATIASTTFTASAIGKAVGDAMPDPSYSNRQFRSIFGDGVLISIDGGTTSLNQISSWEVVMTTGAQLYNRSGTSLSPVGTWQGDRRIEFNFGSDVDDADSTIFRAMAEANDHDVQILAGGLTSTTGGAILLLRAAKMRLRRAAPNTPRDGLSALSVRGVARGSATTAGVFTSPFIAYIR